MNDVDRSGLDVAEVHSGPLVKICGLTRIEDALAALEAGADWLGFIRWPGAPGKVSPRYRPLAEWAALLSELHRIAPKPFEAVGVYVDADRETILREHALAGFDRAQLHGSEPMSFIEGLPIPSIKVIKIKDAASIGRASEYPGTLLLTDTDDPALPGGTGRTYDPTLLTDLARTRPLLLAGGLTPENVGDAVRHVHPFGVDVSSGVESSPGVKDHAKVAAFVRAAKSA